MTREKCLELIDRYERFLEPLSTTKLKKPKDPEMVRHLLGMLPQMRLFVISNPDKFMRWLGFIQGVLWQRKWFTLEELKEHSRP